MNDYEMLQLYDYNYLTTKELINTISSEYDRKRCLENFDMLVKRLTTALDFFKDEVENVKRI